MTDHQAPAYSQADLRQLTGTAGATMDRRIAATLLAVSERIEVMSEEWGAARSTRFRAIEGRLDTLENIERSHNHRLGDQERLTSDIASDNAKGRLARLELCMAKVLDAVPQAGDKRCLNCGVTIRGDGSCACSSGRSAEPQAGDKAPLPLCGYIYLEEPDKQGPLPRCTLNRGHTGNHGGAPPEPEHWREHPGTICHDCDAALYNGPSWRPKVCTRCDEVVCDACAPKHGCWPGLQPGGPPHRMGDQHLGTAGLVSRLELWKVKTLTLTEAEAKTLARLIDEKTHRWVNDPTAPDKGYLTRQVLALFPEVRGYPQLRKILAKLEGEPKP